MSPEIITSKDKGQVVEIQEQQLFDLVKEGLIDPDKWRELNAFLSRFIVADGKTGKPTKLDGSKALTMLTCFYGEMKILDEISGPVEEEDVPDFLK